MNLLRRLAEEAQGHPTPGPQRPPQPPSYQSFRNETQQPNSVPNSIADSSLSSYVSSVESGNEYSSPQLTRRRVISDDNAAETSL